MKAHPTDPIRSLDWDEPISADGHLSVRAVAQLLARYDVGAVLVRGGDSTPGMISERDVTRAVAEGADLDEVWAADLVTGDLMTAEPGERIVDVARRLVEAHVRHVAVVDRDKVVAVLSARDLFGVLVDSV